MTRWVLALSFIIVCCEPMFTADMSAVHAQDIQLDTSHAVVFDHEVSVWSAERVRIRAAQRDARAIAFTREANSLCIAAQKGSKKAKSEAGLFKSVMLPMARHYRNEAAASALVAYSQRVAIEHSDQFVDRIDGLLARLSIAAQRAREMKSNSDDPTQHDREQLKLQVKRTEMAANVNKLNVELGARLDISQAEVKSMYLSDPLTIHFRSVDIDAAINEGMRSRGDIQAVRNLCQCMSVDNLAAVGSIFSMLMPGLGNSLSKNQTCLEKLKSICRGSHQAEEELQTRRQQCNELLEFTKMRARIDIQTSSFDLIAAFEKAKLAEDTMNTWSQRVEQLTRLVELGDGEPAAVEQAKLAYTEAESAHYQAILDVRVAEIRWAEHQGIVAN